eukprot:807296_1
MCTKLNHQIKIENAKGNLIVTKMNEMVSNLIHMETAIFQEISQMMRSHGLDLFDNGKDAVFMQCRHLTLIREIGHKYTQIVRTILNDNTIRPVNHISKQEKIANTHEPNIIKHEEDINSNTCVSELQPIEQDANTNHTVHHHEEEAESGNDMERIHPQPKQKNPNMSVQNNNPQQQKLQMARTLVEVSKGSVSLERVVAMSFDQVQNLHHEIVSRLNQSGQQQQAAHHSQVQPQQAQGQQRDPSNPHPDQYNTSTQPNNIGSRSSDRKRRSKKRNIDQMSNCSHMTSRNKRQKTSHGP